MEKNFCKKRIELIDEVRGIAVFCMLVYHSLFILDEMFACRWAEKAFDFFTPVEPFFAGVFIFICGLSCTLSSNNLKRGLILLGVALGFTVVTCFVFPAFTYSGFQIRFGILHFLSCSVLIYCLLKKLKININPYIGLILCVFLYALFSPIEKGFLSYGEIVVLPLPKALYQSDWLMPLGIYSPSFFSSDYFPIFPSIFIFLSGTLAGKIFTARDYPEAVYKKRCAFFGFLGKKALIIYVVHMPLIFAVCYAVDYIIIPLVIR